jgi:hypothetical protein
MRSLSTVCSAHTQGKHEPGSTPQFGTSSEHGQQGSSPGGPGVGASFQPSPTPSTPSTDMGHKVGGRLSRDLTGVRPPRAGEGSSEHVLRVEERPGSTAQWTNEGTADGLRWPDHQVGSDECGLGVDTSDKKEMRITRAYLQGRLALSSNVNSVSSPYIQSCRWLGVC